MKNVEVYSTYALDRFIRNDSVFKESDGGPAYFIHDTLKKLTIQHSVYSPDSVVVEILITDTGEFGKVPIPPHQDLIIHKENSLLLVSTLLDDWNLVEGDSPIYLDVQGYVRNGSDFGKKRYWQIPESLWRGIACLKGTEEEVSYLENSFVLDQKKQRQLIITKGPQGVDLYIQGEFFHVPAQRIDNLPDTVGAGDTWFASYVAKQALGKDSLESAQFATAFTADFLKGKIK